MKRCITCVSGSEAGPEPDSYTPSCARQRYGKLRFRSTPAALWRLPAAAPSGLASSTSHRAVPRGGRRRRSRAITGFPASSFPCTAPTTITFVRARGLPTRRARIGRPCPERPITSQPAWAGTAGADGATLAARLMNRAPSSTATETTAAG